MRRTILALALVCTVPAALATGGTLLRDIHGANYSWDADAQLAWLDVPETRNLSFNDVLTGAGGWLMSGWRYATADEVVRLFRTNLYNHKPLELETNEWRKPYEGSFTGYAAYENNRATRLIEKLGGTMGLYPEWDDGTFTTAFYLRPVEGKPDRMYIGSVLSQFGFGFADTATTRDRDGHDMLVGHFLVRHMDPSTVPPVPEPSTYALMFAGLGLVGWVARKRQGTVRASADC